MSTASVEQVIRGMFRGEEDASKEKFIDEEEAIVEGAAEDEAERLEEKEVENETEGLVENAEEGSVEESVKNVSEKNAETEEIDDEVSNAKKKSTKTFRIEAIKSGPRALKIYYDAEMTGEITSEIMEKLHECVRQTSRKTVVLDASKAESGILTAEYNPLLGSWDKERNKTMLRKIIFAIAEGCEECKRSIIDIPTDLFDE